MRQDKRFDLSIIIIALVGVIVVTVIGLFSALGEGGGQVGGFTLERDRFAREMNARLQPERPSTFRPYYE